MKAKITPEIAFKRVFVYCAAMQHIIGKKPISRELASLARSADIPFPTIESIRASAIQSGLLTPDFKLTQTGEMIMRGKLTLTDLPADSAVIKSLSTCVKFNFTNANRTDFDLLNLGADCFNNPTPVQTTAPTVVAALPTKPNPPAPNPVVEPTVVEPEPPEENEEDEDNIEDVSAETAEKVDWDAMGKAMRECNATVAEGQRLDKEIGALEAQCAGQKPVVKNKRADVARKFIFSFTKAWISATPDKATTYDLKDWSLKATKAAWDTYASGGCLQDGYYRISTALNSIGREPAKFKELVDSVAKRFPQEALPTKR